MAGCNCGSKKNTTYTVTTKDGEVFSGLASQHEANVLAVKTGGTVRPVSG